MITYYDILGVSESATQEEIRAAYHAQIKYFHPDVFPGDKEVAKRKTLQLNEAYSVLSDPDVRREYDRYLNGEEYRYQNVSQSNKYRYQDPEQKRKTENVYSEMDKKPDNRLQVVLSLAVSLVVLVGAVFWFGASGEKNTGAPSDKDNSIQADENGSTQNVEEDKSYFNFMADYDDENTEPEKIPEPLPLPKTGDILDSSTRVREAPFTVSTRGDSNYLVKLKDSITGYDVMVFFVRGGETAELDVPLGDFEMYYATGEEWYGLDDLFGDDTRYYKAEDRFMFYEENGYINGWTVELYLQSNGNLDTVSVDKSDF